MSSVWEARTAQIERRTSAIHRMSLQYDNVMNRQKSRIYEQRMKQRDIIRMVEELVSGMVHRYHGELVRIMDEDLLWLCSSPARYKMSLDEILYKYRKIMLRIYREGRRVASKHTWRLGLHSAQVDGPHRYSGLNSNFTDTALEMRLLIQKEKFGMFRRRCWISWELKYCM